MKGVHSDLGPSIHVISGGSYAFGFILYGLLGRTSDLQDDGTELCILGFTGGYLTSKWDFGPLLFLICASKGQS